MTRCHLESFQHFHPPIWSSNSQSQGMTLFEYDISSKASTKPLLSRRPCREKKKMIWGDCIYLGRYITQEIWINNKSWAYKNGNQPALKKRSIGSMCNSSSLGPDLSVLKTLSRVNLKQECTRFEVKYPQIEDAVLPRKCSWIERSFN